jgi:hypothetical protein
VNGRVKRSVTLKMAKYGKRGIQPVLGAYPSKQQVYSMGRERQRLGSFML